VRNNADFDGPIFSMTHTAKPANDGASGLEPLRRIDTCTLANAIETFQIRPRNEGFMDSSVVCRFPNRPPAVGHAVTGKIRTYMPPMAGKCYYDHIEWWQYLVTIPPPRIIVLQDFDERVGFGALFGEVHARISKALDCVAYITNGAVRDLQGIEATGLQLFSGSVSVSHSYAHIVDFGGAVEFGGLRVRPGDVLHGDRNGVISVPKEIIPDLPRATEQLQSEERDLFALCERSDFSLELLAARLEQFAERHKCR
jgi:4-hydroxy-4-methyl-2-oxoglutarate aldolase